MRKSRVMTDKRDMRGDGSIQFVSIPQARLIELVSMFAILYVAREIAGFTYRSGLVVGVFLIINKFTFYRGERS